MIRIMNAPLKAKCGSKSRAAMVIFAILTWNLDLRKPDLRKNLDLRKIVAITTDFLVHKLFDLRKIF
jgi:hypothetical protein